jgi:hypothetical protein
LAELVIVSFVVPNMPAADVIATPTLDLLAEPEGVPSDDIEVVATEKPSDSAPSTNLGDGCVLDKLNLTFPSPGQEIRDTVELVGTVNIENFGFYKYEVAPEGSDAWATISAGREVVVDGPLGNWDTSVVTPGDYRIRLIAIDNEGAETFPCVVPVRVLAP